MTVHRARPSTKTQNKPLCLCIVNNKEAFHPHGVVTVEKVGDHFLTFWPLAMNIESCYPLRLPISFSKAFNAYGKYTAL